jgi:sugar O-acyltransferase (sialic acid O-acetyltransferase NeuD family)
LRIAIYGAGGLGKEFRGMIESMGFIFSGFIDDSVKVPEVNLSNVDDVVIAVARTEHRQKIYKNLYSSTVPFNSIIHSSVPLHSSVKLGQGCVICPGVRITVDISIGDFAIVNLNATIGHDVKIGNFVSIMPCANISGNVTIGDRAFIGSGAVILQGLTIGEGATVGAGAVVTKNVKVGVNVVGVPAREMKK